MQPPVPHSTLRSIYATYPNETRLRELLDLQNRKLAQGPGPGTYSLEAVANRKGKTCFRRQALPKLDGPFLPQPADTRIPTTREKEIEVSIRQGCPDSGIAPGQYNPRPVERAAPKTTIGTSNREGRATHPKTLSVSRSIQHGIDWHTPVILQQAADPAGQRLQPPRPPPDAAEQAERAYYKADQDSRGGNYEDQYASPSSGRLGGIPAPSGGKIPPPPAAVSRSIRRLETAPADWDWQRLGHNYRSNFTTAHGGAFSHGDRSTARRERVDSVDYTHAYDMRNLASTPVNSLGQIFPIAENDANAADGMSGFADDITGRRRVGEGGEEGGEADSMPQTPAMGGGYASNSNASPSSPSRLQRVPAADPGLLLSEGDMMRREEAMRAAHTAAQVAARKAAWNAKALFI